MINKMMKKNINRTISRIIKAALFSLCLTSCDSLYNSVFDKLLTDTIESEVPYKGAIVEQRILESIYIKENPIKTVYTIDDEFFTQGICVIAQYKDESEVDVTDCVSYSGFSSDKENEKIPITVTYSENGVTADTTFNVAVLINYIKVQSLVFEEDYKNSIIGLGNTRQLQVTVLPEDASFKAVAWQSSDPSIASVSEDGLVTAVKEESVTITAISVDNPKITAECSVEAKYYHAESVKINVPEEQVRIEETKSTQLTAVVLPALASQKVNWKSEDESVATVDNDGVITGVKSGRVQIIAMSDDDESKTDSYTVEIFKYPVKSIQIKDEEGNALSEDGLTVFVDGSAKLTAAVNEDATHKECTWSSSDESVATVNADGLVTAINGGNAKIVATSVDAPEVMAECAVTVTEVTELEPQDYQIGDVILKDGTFVSCSDIDTMTSEQKAKAVAVIYGYRTEVTENGTESYALGIALDHADELAWCTEDSPGYDSDFTELYSSYDYDYIYESEFNYTRVYKFTGNTDGSDDWACICSQDSVGTKDPATYYPAWNYVNNYGENKGFKGYYKTAWYMPSLKEGNSLAQNLSAVDNVLSRIGGKKVYDRTSSYTTYVLTSSTDTASSVYKLRVYGYNSIDLFFGLKSDTYEVTTIPIKAFPCSVAHYDDTVQSTLSLTYPSYSQGNLSLSNKSDDEGNYIFTVKTNDSSWLPENASYRWILDNNLLDESYISDDGTKLTLPADFLASLVSGRHVITVLQEKENGELFDACCYINITNGTESSFTPQENPITVLLPVFSESTLTINRNYADDTYTFEAVDSSHTYIKYTWFLDGKALEETDSTLLLASTTIEELKMGAHLLTLLAKTQNGEYFDAQFYIKRYE